MNILLLSAYYVLRTFCVCVICRARVTYNIHTNILRFVYGSRVGLGFKVIANSILTILWSFSFTRLRKKIIFWPITRRDVHNRSWDILDFNYVWVSQVKYIFIFISSHPTSPLLLWVLLLPRFMSFMYYFAFNHLK